MLTGFTSTSLHPHHTPVSLSMLSLKDVSTSDVSQKELILKDTQFPFLNRVKLLWNCCRTGTPKMRSSLRAQTDALNKLYKMFWKHRCDNRNDKNFHKLSEICTNTYSVCNIASMILIFFRSKNNKYFQYFLFITCTHEK